jgi:hypothetical protein
LDTVVRQAFANSLLSLLLLTTLVWGGCISCEQYFMFGGGKGCCGPDGHCNRKEPPSKQSSTRQCNQIDFDQHKTIDHHIDLPVIVDFETTQLLWEIEGFERWDDVNSVTPSPPDLQVLHSTFLI